MTMTRLWGKAEMMRGLGLDTTFVDLGTTSSLHC